MLIDEIRQGESAELELKRAPNEQPERWLKTGVAFANCKGGRIGNSIRLIVKRGHANHVNHVGDNRGDNRGDYKGDNRGDNPLLSLPDEQHRICDILKGNPKISIRKMAEMLGIRKNTLDKQLSALKAKGFIERRNGTRGSWQVILSPRD